MACASSRFVSAARNSSRRTRAWPSVIRNFASRYALAPVNALRVAASFGASRSTTPVHWPWAKRMAPMLLIAISVSGCSSCRSSVFCPTSYANRLPTAICRSPLCRLRSKRLNEFNRVANPPRTPGEDNAAWSAPRPAGRRAAGLCCVHRAVGRAQRKAPGTTYPSRLIPPRTLSRSIPTPSEPIRLQS